MITTGAKFYFGLGFLLLVAAVLYGWTSGGVDWGLFPGHLGDLYFEMLGALTLGYKGAVGDHLGFGVLLGGAAASTTIGSFMVAFRDADDKPLGKDPALATKAVTIEVLGAKLSVREADVDKMIGITTKSSAADRNQSREDFPEYWELRDAMVAMWYATEAQKAPFYLYACNLAQIAGFKELFRGFDRPVFGSTDATGPKTNWEVEWESEDGDVSPLEKTHAEQEVFERPGEMKLELHVRNGLYRNVEHTRPPAAPRKHTRSKK